MFRKKISFVILALIAGSLMVILLNNRSLPAPTESNPDFQSTIITTSQNPEIRLATKNHTATMTLMNASATNAIKKNNQITFVDIQPHTDAVYTQVKNGIKEDIILRQVPTQPVSYTFSLNPEGLKPQFFQGQYYFFDQNGYAQLTIPKPFMIDAAGVRSEAVSVEITRTGSTYKSIIIPDYDWLTSTQRKYPVTIDPSLMVPDSPLRELADRRTISSKTYDLGNGKFAATSGLEAIHYQDTAGKWQDTLTTIVPSTDPEYDYMNLTNNFHTYFSTDGFGNKLAVKFEVGDAWMKFRLANNATGSGQLNPATDNIFTYQNVYQQADKFMDAAYTLSDTQLLEEIILNQFQGFPDISQEIELHNAYFKADGAKINAYRQGTNELLWIIPAPVMYEVNNPEVRSYGLHYEIKPLTENRILLTKVIDPEGEAWLDDPSRNYPLVIDTTAGPNSPGTMTNDTAVGTIAWSNPDNAKVSNNIRATMTGAGNISNYLKATNMGFDIPTSSEINGILVAIELYGGISYENRIQIVKSDGSIGTENKSTGATLPTSETYVSYGNSTNVWSESWTSADINNPNFGTAIAVTAGTAGGGQGQCLNPDSFISTPNGYKQIKDFKINDSVFSFNEYTRQVEIKNVEFVTHSPITNANNRYFYIYYQDRVIKATENHKFYINGNYVRADQLQVGDQLLDIHLQTHPIEKINTVPNTTDQVWDLSVADNHNFFTNDILVHNLPGTVYVDHISITVYYTESEPTPLPVTKFDGINLNGVKLNQ